MMIRLLAAAILVAVLSPAALGQQSSSPSQSPSNQQSPQSTQPQGDQNISQELQQKLTDAGYTEIKIVPRSFIVTGKNKQGQEVMMRITPNSVTMLTEVPMDSNATVGSGAGGSGNSNNSTQDKSNSSPNPNANSDQRSSP